MLYAQRLKTLLDKQESWSDIPSALKLLMLQKIFKRFVAFAIRKENYAYDCKVTSWKIRFSDLTTLMDHKRLVHNYTKIKCQVKDCDRIFSRYSNFLRHCDAHQVKATRDKCGKLLAPNYIAKCKARVYKNVLLLKCSVTGYQKIFQSSHMVLRNSIEYLQYV